MALLAGARALIESGKCGENAYWRFFSDGTLEISGTGAIESDPWNNMQHDFSDAIVRLIISDGITSMLGGCFYKAENLVSAILPDSITSIPYACFYGNINLVSAVLPDSITVIDGDGFRSCSNLILEHLPADLTYLGNNALYGCNSISITKMPAGLTHIGSYQFRECFGLQKIYLYSTPVIEKNAFLRCDNLTDIYVPWAEGEVAGAPWGADISTSGAKQINIHYNTVYDENGEPITEA